jgi:HD-GYP domain-containing protein (c-di-GMP phosphodiesterase class II)
MNDESKAKQEIINKLNDMRHQLDEAKNSEPEIRPAQSVIQTPVTRYRRLFEIAHSIAVIVETRDPFKAGHHQRVAALASAIGTEMDLTNDYINGIRMAGMIHDIGKISVPAVLLNKPTRLTETEFQLMKTHAQSGYDILQDVEFPWPISRIVLEHHERLNGSGYPRGLTSDALLVESRILAVADIVDAIISPRSYRPARGIDVALYDIAGSKGVLYDPDVVDVCLRLFNEKGYKIVED